MKTTCLAIAAVSLLQITSAQPHRRRHAHGAQHQNAKKDDVVVTVIDTVYAEATNVPEVIVYVDQNGVPVSTTTEYIHVSQTSWSTAFGSASTPAYAPPAPPSSSTSSSTTVAPVVASAPVQNVQAPVASKSTTPEAVVQPASSTTVIVAEVQPVTTAQAQAAAPVAVTTAQAAAPVVATTAAAAPVVATVAASSSSSSQSSGFGVSYSPYNADGTCKTQAQVTKDFESLSGYALVRIYGTDCNQVATVLSACKAKGLKVFAGVYNIGALAAEIATIVAAANGDWSRFDTISIGNELVNSGAASASTVVAAIGTARVLLKAAGYSGKIVTVDTLVATRDNPSLCDASDYCAVNCHPFFDGTYVAADSGKFLADMIPTLAAKLANKNQQIVITETGWPWLGQNNGKAVPSLDNQAAALSSIKSHFAATPGSVILFTAFNDMWKKNTAAQFGAEQYWGLGGSNAPSG